ncbi:MAG: DVU0298 family protein [Nitrospirota bacterium]
MDKSIKQQVESLLRQRDDERLIELCLNDRNFWKELRFRLYDMDERLRWAAIETVAKFMKLLWQTGKKEKVREYMRNLFWSINDESGGIGWSAPHGIAEIIINIPELLDPYGSMMIAHTLEEPPLVKGGLWGIGRLGRQIAESVEFFQEMVLAVFQSSDVEVLGLAAWASGEVVFKPALPFLKNLFERKEPVRIYIKGDFHEKPLGRWAEEAIIQIKKEGLA